MLKTTQAILIYAIILFLVTACATDEASDILDLLDSTDFVRKVEVLPQFLEPYNFSRLFSDNMHSSDELDRIHDNILISYLIALIETNEDDLLRENVVNIFRMFRHAHSESLVNDIFIRNPSYSEKLGIIISELTKAYEGIAEERFHARIMRGSHLRGLLLIDGQYGTASIIEQEIERIIADEMLVAFEYERKIREGEITIGAVPERFKYQVEQLIEGRQEDGGFDLSFSW